MKIFIQKCISALLFFCSLFFTCEPLKGDFIDPMIRAKLFQSFKINLSTSSAYSPATVKAIQAMYKHFTGDATGVKKTTPETIPWTDGKMLVTVTASEAQNKDVLTQVHAALHSYYPSKPSFFAPTRTALSSSSSQRPEGDSTPKSKKLQSVRDAASSQTFRSFTSAQSTASKAQRRTIPATPPPAVRNALALQDVSHGALMLSPAARKTLSRTTLTSAEDLARAQARAEAAHLPADQQIAIFRPGAASQKDVESDRDSDGASSTIMVQTPHVPPRKLGSLVRNKHTAIRNPSQTTGGMIKAKHSIVRRAQ